MKKSPLVLIFLFNVFIYSCTNGQGVTQTQVLNSIEFQKKIQDTPNAIVVDVRTPDEFNRGHLQNAINIDVNNENFGNQIGRLDKTKPVLIYCLSGSRSAYAAKVMRTNGFKEVYDLSGGMMKWRAAGLPETTNKSVASAEMSSTQFKEILNTDKLVLVDVYADWCAPCKKMAPYLEEIQKEKASTVKIVRINADQNRSLMNDLKVTALPTLLLYKNKAVVWSNTGYLTKEEITSHLTKQ